MPESKPGPVSSETRGRTSNGVNFILNAHLSLWAKEQIALLWTWPQSVCARGDRWVGNREGEPGRELRAAFRMQLRAYPSSRCAKCADRRLTSHNYEVLTTSRLLCSIRSLYLSLSHSQRHGEDPVFLSSKRCCQEHSCIRFPTREQDFLQGMGFSGELPRWRLR